MEIQGTSLVDKLKLIKGAQEIGSKELAPTEHPVAGASEKSTFSDYLLNQMRQANELTVDADKRIQASVSGEETNPHATYIAIQKADISFRLLMTVKERLIEAYQTIMRTPIG